MSNDSPNRSEERKQADIVNATADLSRALEKMLASLPASSHSETYQLVRHQGLVAMAAILKNMAAD